MEVCIHLRQPDGSFPPLGPLPAPNFDAVELCTIVDSDFQREDLPSTDPTSHALPETGCYVMRDSWEPDAQYLFFDAHPSGKPNNTNTSTFVLYAHGRHLTSGAVRVPEMPLSASDRIDTQWITTPAFDCVEKWHQTTTVHHKRAIFYRKGEYFILHDLVLGDAAHILEQVFHLGRGEASHIGTDTGSTWTQDARRSNLFIGAVETTDLSVTVDDGQLYLSTASGIANGNEHIVISYETSHVKEHPILSDYRRSRRIPMF